ncbi:neuronal acetylcholine receptor subunit alpha-3-like isoform X2 [Nylanderia fulva]|uniref:neuronal acetylcholine receptor subunit alpha-3-like isoform X2 n=1 Tax=Nylanderia fulva TaxID=613905 RepID=UPI0010FB5ACF|nr:neuronal acetylcholine receptor subunit alpha-3-like isoform X2 [Nylanderia fulva]
MRILQIFGFFIILWQYRADCLYMDTFIATKLEEDVMTRGCKNLEDTTPLLRLKKYLFCTYDNTVRPNHQKASINVTLKLMPKMMEYIGHKEILTLHSWMSFSWTDTHLTWTPNNFDGVTYIHVKSDELWVPDLCVHNSDMSNDVLKMPTTDCLVFNTGSVICVPAVKYMSKCDSDYTYWPYDQQTCHVVLGSWSYWKEEVDFHFDGNGINMDSYKNNTLYDLKFVDAVKHIKKYECCPNNTFPKMDYSFMLIRHYGIKHKTIITPAIALILLTLTVLWLDSRSVERTAVASVNLICHLFCLYDLHWQMPYNGINPPNIMLFYRDSLALATFALILTTLLRKLQNMSTDMPNWISSSTMFVINNRAGRFLILKDEKSKITGDSIVIEDSSDLSKSGRKESWRYFAAIVEWLSFFCVFLIYVIILITLLPTG